MKVEKKKICFEKEEKDLKNLLKETLNDFFGLTIKDFPIIVKKIGIKDKKYEVEFKSKDEYSVSLKIKAEETFNLKFFNGVMIVPYACCSVAKEGEAFRTYVISKKIKVKPL